ncbi:MULTISPECIES: CHAT domain-containing protein [unclassified Microcoleus]|uniref:CHAT domain-containing protein n=1 Tax=unclassified Microcoleus TaxID=2642155 RepID=UPI002FD3B6A3
MGKLVVLTFAEGDLDKKGFSVTLQLGEEGKPATLQEMGSLPPNPELVDSYTSWKVTYYGFIGVKVRKLEAKVAQTTNFSIGEVNAQAKNLSQNFNQWLKSQQFSHVREELVAHLKQDDEVRLIIQTSNIQLRQLPWHLWDILERYPKAEISVSAPKFKEVTSAKIVNNQVNILAILGDSEGINVEQDRKLLNSLPGVKVEFLVNPNREKVTNKLWEQSWEILFFAGHSCTQGETGIIYINKTESLTIPDLRYALKKAIEKGLQLAIFNSCDGLGLAQDLADLNLPQMIVMREPVPDKVAQEFLKYFLRSFSEGQSFYLAVREARERLQSLESQFPCASWMPVIFSLRDVKHISLKKPLNRLLQSVAEKYWLPLIVSGAIIWFSINLFLKHTNPFIIPFYRNIYVNYNRAQKQQREKLFVQNSKIFFLTEDTRFSNIVNGQKVGEIERSDLEIRFTIYNNENIPIKIFNLQTVSYGLGNQTAVSATEREIVEISPDKPFIEQNRTFEIKPGESRSFLLRYHNTVSGNVGSVGDLIGIVVYYHNPRGEIGKLKSETIYGLLIPVKTKIWNTTALEELNKDIEKSVDQSEKITLKNKLNLIQSTLEKHKNL